MSIIDFLRESVNSRETLIFYVEYFMSMGYYKNLTIGFKDSKLTMGIELHNGSLHFMA